MRNWFEMRASDKGVGEILIYDEIGPSFWGEATVTAKDFDRSLKALGDIKEIFLRVNSPGGVVYDAVAIFNTLKNHGARIKARVDGIAASAASLIVMAADEIVMPENAFLLIHEPRTVAWGTASSLLSAAADLETMTKTFASTYASRAKMSEADVVALMAEDRLMSAEEAVSLGLADKTDKPVKMAANFSLAKLPSDARERIMLVMTKETETTKEPVAVSAPAEKLYFETVADLEAFAPLMVNQIRAEAAEAERARILGIEDVAVPGHDALVATMKADGKTTPDQAAAAILKAEKASRGAHMRKIEGVEEETSVVTAAPNGAAAKPDVNSMSDEDLGEQYDRDDNIRAEFPTKQTYVAFMKAQASGRVRILSSKRSAA